MCSGHIVFRGMDPDRVGWIDHVFRQAMMRINRESKERCMKRCLVYYEELMHNRWNPDRIDDLCSKGYVIGDL